MKKTAIVYASYHHNNTEKLVQAVAEKFPEITLINCLKTDSADLSEFEEIGFASGIYFYNFHKKLLRFAEANLPQDKKTFLMCTCGSKNKKYFNSISKIIEDKNGTVEDKYIAYGWDTYGPLRMIIGLKKGHPDQSEIAEAITFVEKLIN